MASRLQLAKAAAAASAAAASSNNPTTSATASQPRSILKKASSGRRSPQFYSGNEFQTHQTHFHAKTEDEDEVASGNATSSSSASSSETEEDEQDDCEDDPSELIYNSEKRITIHPHKAAIKAVREKKSKIKSSSAKSISKTNNSNSTCNNNTTNSSKSSGDDLVGELVDNLRFAANGFDADVARRDEDVRFRCPSPHCKCAAKDNSNVKSLKKSSLTSIKHHRKRHNRVRRKPSSAYILNNRQIDAEVINCMRESICEFIDEFKRTMNLEECEDARLLAESDYMLRRQFLSKLREYLCDEESGTGSDSTNKADTETVTACESLAARPPSPSAYQTPQNAQKQRSFALELRVSLSEPVIGRDAVWRSSRPNTSQISNSRSSIGLEVERLKRFDFVGDSMTSPSSSTTTSPSSNKIKSIKDKATSDIISGSLPVTSCMEAYMRTMKQHQKTMAAATTTPCATSTTSVVPGGVGRSGARLNEMLTELLRKSSSGNLASTPPTSSSKCIVSATTANKKAVRFADSFGLDLASVRIITNNSFMGAFTSSTASDLDEQMESTNYPCTGGTSPLDFGSSAVFNAISVPFLVLIPLFSIRRPLNNDFVIKLDEYLFDYENQFVKCIVKVRNLSYEKRVFARITFNSWKTSYDLDAVYLRPDATQPTQYDSFGFCIIIPEKSILMSSSSLYSSNSSSSSASSSSSSASSSRLDDCFCRIEFALCCVQKGQSYWDSNGGENYKFQCFYNIKN